MDATKKALMKPLVTRKLELVHAKDLNGMVTNAKVSYNLYSSMKTVVGLNSVSGKFNRFLHPYEHP